MTDRELDPEHLGDHFDRLYRAAWALCGSREDAEDLVQETYARVLARPRFLRREEDVGYLVRVLRNTFISMRRTAARRPATTAPPDEFDPPDERGELQPESAAQAREVYAAIAALQPDYRDALIAIDVAGLSYHEAAKALRVPEGTVTSRLYRARAQVARELAPPLARSERPRG